MVLGNRNGLGNKSKWIEQKGKNFLSQLFFLESGMTEVFIALEENCQEFELRKGIYLLMTVRPHFDWKTLEIHSKLEVLISSLILACQKVSL